LPAWERLVFGLVFALMATFVVTVTLSAARNGGLTAANSTRSVTSAASDRLQTLGQGASTGRNPAPNGISRASVRAQASPDKRLAAALRPLIRQDAGHLAVGIIDVRTGAGAAYEGSRHFRAGSLEKADILAALLLKHLRAGTQLTAREAVLAAPMMETDDGEAATELYRELGGPAGIKAANRILGLSHTVAGPPADWSRNATTVRDQLRLLSDLIDRDSPLSSASRGYELGLMENVQPSQRWGVSSAATSGTSFAISDGWLADRNRWVTNSIGVVQHDGQPLLIAVLADDQPTEAGGIAIDDAVAAAAAKIITATS
jgi:hypothetical protein